MAPPSQTTTRLLITPQSSQTRRGIRTENKICRPLSSQEKHLPHGGDNLAKTILVTGAAGFIGSHTVESLIQRGDSVVGIDNFNDYYDPARKRANLAEVNR